jgi:hypothetical protein
MFKRADDVFFRVQILPGLPLVNDLATGCDLDNNIPKHLGRDRIGVKSSLNFLCESFRQGLPLDEQRVARWQSFIIVMEPIVTVLPDHMAVPVQLEDRRA